MKTISKIIFGTVAALVVAGAVALYFNFYFQLGEGVKAGELNQVVYKGWIWKTYEGRIIQSGFRGAKSGSGIQSNEFNFSVVDKAVAEELMRCSGKTVELRYVEYNGALPWRGMQKHIVTEIISVRDIGNSSAIPFDAVEAGNGAI